MASKSNKRCYLTAYKYAPHRPPVFEDFGENLTLSGAVFQGLGETLVLLFPGAPFTEENVEGANFEQPSIENWNEIIRQTDNAEIFVGEVGGIRKVLHRKQMYALSGDVQQRVWVRDGLACVYCGRKMGEILLTIDHFVPLEFGGLNDETNYVTACRKCNKNKGMLMPEEFCRIKGFNFKAIVEALEKHYPGSQSDNSRQVDAGDSNG